MTSGTRDIARAPQWIACRREARSVNDGEVFCPRGDLVAWQSCLECRLLEAVEDDRELGCGELETSPPPTSWQRTIGPIGSPVMTHAAPAERTPAELIVELL